MKVPDHMVGNHKLMMASPDYWPQWPLLPLIRNSEDNGVGVLLDRKGQFVPVYPPKYIVVLCNMFANLEGAESI